MTEMRTWSYTIMGSSQANNYWAEFSEHIFSFIPIEEIMELNRRSENLSNERLSSIINDHYEVLVSLAIRKKSRLAYQVLGVYLMDNGAKMTNALKELILINSRWDDEKDQLFNEKDKAERFYYLSEFREAIKNYKEGVKTMITWESNNQVVERLQEQGVIDDNYPFILAPDRTPIKYDIKGETRNQKEINVDWVVKLIKTQEGLEEDRF
ncbi:MAG: hypothetical protein ACFFG0_51545 [Candidatus Thorarchaeota archaeon]